MPVRLLIICGLLVSASSPAVADSSTELDCPSGTQREGDASEQWCERFDVLSAKAQRHGPTVAKHPDGTMRQRGTYRNGRMDGPWREWRADGALRVAADYALGQLHGAYRETTDSGQRLVGEYLNGVRHGTWTTFERDGEVMTRGRYRKGKRHGSWIHWDESGKETKRESWDNDVLVK